MINSKCHTRLPPAEREHIRRKFHLKGAFVKVMFANETARDCARYSSYTTHFGGKLLRIHSYTPRKSEPVAPPSTPLTSNDGNLSSLMDGLTVGESLPTLGLASELDKMQLSNESIDDEMVL